MQFASNPFNINRTVFTAVVFWRTILAASNLLPDVSFGENIHVAQQFGRLVQWNEGNYHFAFLYAIIISQLFAMLFYAELLFEVVFCHFLGPSDPIVTPGNVLTASSHELELTFEIFALPFLFERTACIVNDDMI